MKTKIKKEIEVDINTLIVSAGVRYWEDAMVDGKEDVDGDLIPCREGQYWKPIIDLDNGKIVNWDAGCVADIHYKVCDDGNYKLRDNFGNIVGETDGYVPNIMCPEENGYGDYIIMKVDKDGFIANWKVDIKDFLNNDED